MRRVVESVAWMEWERMRPHGASDGSQHGTVLAVRDLGPAGTLVSSQSTPRADCSALSLNRESTFRARSVRPQVSRAGLSPRLASIARCALHGAGGTMMGYHRSLTPARLDVNGTM
jgi:hypothetical protein